MSLPTIVSIANALDVSLDELLYTDLNKSSHISVRIIDELISDCTPDEISALAEVIKNKLFYRVISPFTDYTVFILKL